MQTNVTRPPESGFLFVTLQISPSLIYLSKKQIPIISISSDSVKRLVYVLRIVWVIVAK